MEEIKLFQLPKAVPAGYTFRSVQIKFRRSIMLPIAVELLTVTEQNPREYVSILNEEFFIARGIKDPNSYLKSMLIISREKLLNEISTADRRRTVECTPNRSFRDSVMSISFLLDEDFELILLTYFGKKIPPETSYVVALSRVLELVVALEDSISAMEKPVTKIGEQRAVRGIS